MKTAVHIELIQTRHHVRGSKGPLYGAHLYIYPGGKRFGNPHVWYAPADHVCRTDRFVTVGTARRAVELTAKSCRSAVAFWRKGGPGDFLPHAARQVKRYANYVRQLEKLLKTSGPVAYVEIHQDYVVEADDEACKEMDVPETRQSMNGRRRVPAPRPA